MKKILYVLTGLLLITFISTLFFDDFNIFVQYIRHISLLIVIAILTFVLSNSIAIKIINRYHLHGHKEMFVQLTRVFMFGFVLIGVAYVQFQYINYSIGLNVDYCRYYDKYDNLLYENRFRGDCPEIDIIEQSDETLKLHVLETTVFYQSGNTLIDDIYYKDAKLYYTRDVTIEANYTNNALAYAYSTENATVLLESDNGNVGRYQKQIDIIDYSDIETQGYLIKTAVKTLNIEGSKSEIRDFDYNDLTIEAIDFDITKYIITNESPNNYVLSKEVVNEGVIEKTQILKVNRIKPDLEGQKNYQIDSIITADQESLGLVEQYLTITEVSDSKRIVYVNEYEDEYYNTEQIFKLRNNFESFYSSYTYHTDLEDVDYRIWKSIKSVKSNENRGKYIYYDVVNTDGLGFDFVIKTYKAFETKDFGTQTTVYYENEYQYLNSFWGYLFHADTSSRTRINTGYRTIASNQKESFTYYGLLATISRDDFYVLPVYMRNMD